MTTHTIKAASGAQAGSHFFGDLARAAAAISAGWRAARDWRRLSVRSGGMSREEVAREVFERNFA